MALAQVGALPQAVRTIAATIRAGAAEGTVEVKVRNVSSAQVETSGEATLMLRALDPDQNPLYDGVLWTSVELNTGKFDGFFAGRPTPGVVLESGASRQVRGRDGAILRSQEQGIVMNNNPHRGNSHKEKSMNTTIKTTSAAVLVTLGFALAALPPTVSTAADSAAPALAPAKTTAPTGPYHAGCLNFTAPGKRGKQAVELFIQFRDGRGLASHVLVDGKFYSPDGIITQRGDAPNVALDNVEVLRFDGTKLQGDWKWVTQGAVETITFEATVRDGLVTGKAGHASVATVAAIISKCT